MVSSKCYLSRGVDSIGIDNVIGIIKETIPNDVEIISVGSGNGFFEKKLEKSIQRSVVCVEPDPYGYIPVKEEDKKSLKLPDFGNIRDYLKNQKNGSKCILLNWPEPNESKYDMDSIEIINPEYLVVIYELGGVSGGRKLIEYLNQTREYKPIHKTICNCSYNFIVKLEIAMVVKVRKDVNCVLEEKNLEVNCDCGCKCKNNEDSNYLECKQQ